MQKALFNPAYYSLSSLCLQWHEALIFLSTKKCLLFCFFGFSSHAIMASCNFRTDLIAFIFRAELTFPTLVFGIKAFRCIVKTIVLYQRNKCNHLKLPSGCYECCGCFFPQELTVAIYSLMCVYCCKCCFCLSLHGQNSLIVFFFSGDGDKITLVINSIRQWFHEESGFVMTESLS